MHLYDLRCTKMIIKIFWPIEINDIWFKKICSPKMIVWSGATFDLVRTTLNKSAHHKKKVLTGLITEFCRDASMFSGSWEIFIFCTFPQNQILSDAIAHLWQRGSVAKNTLFTETDGEQARNGHNLSEGGGGGLKNEKLAHGGSLIALLTTSEGKKVIGACYKGHSQSHPSWSDKKLLGATCAPH